MAQDNELVTVAPPSIIAFDAPPGVEIIEHGRQLHMYRISDAELDEAYSPTNSIHLGFFGITVGLMPTTGIVLWTLTLDSIQTAAFTGAFLVSVVLSLYFGIQLARDIINASRRKNAIRGRDLAH